MKVGIIGSGNIGSALAHRFLAVGHEVSVSNSRGPESLTDLAKVTGASAVSVEQAARGNDVVVVAIPLKRVEDLPREPFARAPANVIIVDTGNYYPQQRDGRIDGIEAGLTESAWVEQQLGHAVIKAFNTIFAQRQLEGGKQAGTANRIALAVAGDDSKAKMTVMQLIDEIGFDTVDAGAIDESWRQQPGSPGYCKDLDADGVRRALRAASNTRAPQYRATPNSPGTYESPA